METSTLYIDEETGNYYLYNGSLWYCSPMTEYNEGVPGYSFVEVDDQDEVKKYLGNKIKERN